MTEPVTEPAKEPAKTVPVGDLLAVKSRLKEATSALEEAKTNLVAEKQRLELLEADLNTDSENEDEVRATKKKLVLKHREIERRESGLRDRETKITARERQIQAKELAATFGVEAELLLAQDGDMEKEALRMSHERLSKNTTVKQPIYEVGAPPAGQKAVPQMNAKEFAEYKERLRKQAVAR